ncbi:hypothetical protein DRQ25_12145 [Candidatus Fermentibacteria bacterium]|nr:MAG: hypothetical protein DRQ25_12145 [Candidatus Fermentibacteria bacterium]
MNVIQRQDVSLKLRGSIGIYEGGLIKIDRHHEDSQKVAVGKYTPQGFEGSYGVLQRHIELPKPTLGYFNYQGSSVYLYYDMHRRRYQLGLSELNLGMKTPSNLGSLSYSRLLDTLSPYIYGLKRFPYPSLRDAVDTIESGECSNVALSLNISLTQGTGPLNIFFRGIKVGVYKNHRVKISNRRFNIDQHECLRR